MDLKQLLSKPTESLVSESKVACLQPPTVKGLDQPVIIPVGGTTGVDNPLGVLPVHLLNQPFLIPLDTFQVTKESTLLLPTPIVSTASSLTSSSQAATVVLSSSSSPLLSKALKSEAVIHTQDQEGTLKMNLSVVLDPCRHSVLGQPSVFTPDHLSGSQSMPMPKLNLPRQFSSPPVLEIKKEKEDVPDTQTTELMSDCLSWVNQSSRSPLPCSEMKKCTKTVTQSTSSVSANEIKVEGGQESDHLMESSVETKLDTEGLSKIISSLPPGWKVVGLTNLTGTDGAQTTPVVEAGNFLCGAGSTEGSDAHPHSSSPHHRCRVPDVVSVDLNNPTGSTLAGGLFNESFGGQKIENFLFPISSSCGDSAETRDQTGHKKSPLISSINVADTTSDEFPSSVKNMITIGADLTVSKDQPRPNPGLDMTKGEWRVVGLTSSSIPPQTSLNQQLPTLPLPLPFTISPESGASSDDKLTNARSTKATILNVPTPKLLQPVKPSSPQKSQAQVSSNEEMKWTVVGVTIASTINNTAVLSSNPQSQTTALKKSTNSCITPADCAVTNSQQRPVPSSLSKNAPLSSESSPKGIDSTALNDQWKVVGITQTANQNLSPQLVPIGYQFPLQLPQHIQPLLVTSINSPTTSTTSTAAIATPLTTKSNHSLGLAKSVLRSSPSSLDTHLQNSLTSNLPSTTPYLSPSLLPLPPPHGSSALEHQQQLLHLLQSQILLQQQQQEQQQLLMNQLVVPSQPPLISAMNEWNLVGLLSSLQPSLVNLSSSLPDSSSVDKEKKAVATLKAEREHDSDHTDSKEQQVSSTVDPGTDHKTLNYEGKKCRQSRGKDAAAKFTKKNTVSHLLRLKRMKMKEEGEDGSISLSDQEGSEVVPNAKQEKEKMAFYTRANKEIRSRPLHSYAGNRKIFSKSYSVYRDTSKEKINLRSGVQVPIGDLMSDIQGNCTEIKTEQPIEPHEVPETSNEPMPTTDNRSAARKRKLKIPRKMIADLDYQPFDSSSDSN